MRLYLTVHFIWLLVCINLNHKSNISLELLNHWNRLFLISFSLLFYRLRIIIISTRCLSSFCQSLNRCLLAAIKHEQMEQLNLDTDLLVPFYQVVLVSGESVNQEHTFPVLLLYLLFHKLDNNFGRDQLAQSHWLLDQFFMSAVFFHFLSQQITCTNVVETKLLWDFSALSSLSWAAASQD